MNPDAPLFHVLFSVTLKVQKGICRAYQSCYSRFLQPYFVEEFLTFLIGVEFGNVGFGLCSAPV